MDKLKIFCNSVDKINDWTGKAAAWLLIPLTLIVTLDVFLRYIFNKPTIWAWDINVQLLAALSVLGGGYALLYGAHIGVDVLALRLSPRRRAVLDLVISVFFFFGVIVLLWQAAMAATNSVKTQELYSSFFRPPIYPLKVLMVIGVILLLLQGIVKFIRDLVKVFSVIS